MVSSLEMGELSLSSLHAPDIVVQELELEGHMLGDDMIFGQPLLHQVGHVGG